MQCSRRKASEKEEYVEDPSTSYTPTYTPSHTPSYTPSFTSSYTPSYTSSYTSSYTPSTTSSYASQYSLRREDPVGALLPGQGEPGRARERTMVGAREGAREGVREGAREDARSIEKPARDWQVPGTKRRGYHP